MPCHRRHLCCLVSICPATVVTCAALKSKRPRSFWRCPSGDMPCHRRHLCLSGDMLCHRRHLCCLEIQAPALVLALSEWRYAPPPVRLLCLEIQAPALILALSEWRYALPPVRLYLRGFLWNVCFTLVRATFCHPNVCFTVVRATFCLRNVCFTVVRATFCLRNVCFTMVRATFWRCLNGDMPCHRCGSSALKSKRPHSFPKYAAKHKGFLPRLKNCVRMPCHRCGSIRMALI